MQKMILIDYTRCTGCRLCESICSLYNEGVVNPRRSRIKIVRWEWEGFEVPTVCQQCEDAACIAVCPVKALTRDKELGYVKVNYDLCIGCRMCIMACPFGGMSFDPVKSKVMKCELCGGDPICVKFCETKALQFVDVASADVVKKRDLGAQVLIAMAKAEEQQVQ
jgi:carbon-monoxide dehydrogenase iron sulfur subunit